VAGVKSRIFHGFAGWCFIEVINDAPFVGRQVPVRLLLDASYVHPEDEVSFSQALNAEHWRSQNRGICYKTFDTFRKFTVFIVVSKYLGYDYKHYVGDAPHLTPPQKKVLAWSLDDFCSARARTNTIHKHVLFCCLVPPAHRQLAHICLHVQPNNGKRSPVPMHERGKCQAYIRV